MEEKKDNFTILLNEFIQFLSSSTFKTMEKYLQIFENFQLVNNEITFRKLNL